MQGPQILLTLPSTKNGFLNIISHTLHLMVLGALGYCLSRDLSLSMLSSQHSGILNLS